MPRKGIALATTIHLALVVLRAAPAAAQTGLPPLASGKGDRITTAPAMVKKLVPDVELEPFLTSGETIGEFQFAGTPDGMGAYDNGDGTFTLLVNHEWDRTSKDYPSLRDAMVAKLTVDRRNLHVVAGEYVVDGREGYKRFCSATLVGKSQGFPSDFFLTNEEETSGDAKGIALAINARTNRIVELPQMGHFRHENTTAVPYPGGLALLSGEDHEDGQLYMLLAANAAEILGGSGNLYVLQVLDDRGNPLAAESDLKKGETRPARFVPLSRDQNRDADTLSDASHKKEAFRFIRIEDSEADRNDPRTVWFATTGRRSQVDGNGKPFNGRGNLWKLQLDEADPTKGKITLVLSGDQGDDLFNPDNLAASPKSLMIQEDITSDFPRYGRILRYDLATGALTPIVELVDQHAAGAPVKPGDWESSGMINAFDLLGDGKWIFNVQAHTLRVPQLGAHGEGGQLLVMKLPGS